MPSIRTAIFRECLATSAMPLFGAISEGITFAHMRLIAKCNNGVVVPITGSQYPVLFFSVMSGITWLRLTALQKTCVLTNYCRASTCGPYGIRSRFPTQRRTCFPYDQRLRLIMISTKQRVPRIEEHKNYLYFIYSQQYQCLESPSLS
jgi:hypothetical protein